MTIIVLGSFSFAFVVWFTFYQAMHIDQGQGQSRRAAVMEAWWNIAIGFSANYVANLWLIPLMADGAHVTAASNWWGGWCYTAISILRQFAIRRWHNARMVRRMLEESDA